MKKALCIALAALSAAFSFPVSAENTYIPGKTAAELIRGSLSEGRLLAGSLSFSLAGNKDVLGSSYDDVAAVADYLQTIQFYGAVGNTPEGTRLELAGRLGSTADAPEADVSLTFGEENLLTESSILGSRRFSIRYSSLLSLAGIEENELKSLNPFSALFGNPEFTSGNLFSALLPYMEEAVSFAAGHAGKTEDNLEASEVFPAVDHEYSWDFTSAEAAAFLRTAAEEMRADTSLGGLLGAELQSGCAQLLESAAGSLDGTSAEETSGREIHFYAGKCESAVPAYYVLEINGPADSDGLDFVFVLGHGEEANSITARVIVMVTEGGETALPVDSLFRFTTDPEDPAGIKIEGMANLDDEDLQATLQLYHSLGTLKDENILRGVEAQSYFSVSVPVDESTTDKDEVYTELQAYEPQGGGETLWSAGSVSCSVNDELKDQGTWNSTFSVTPSDAAGFDGSFSLALTWPAQGIEKAEMNVLLQPVAYDAEGAAALTPAIYEDMTEKERGSLLEEVRTNVFQFYFSACRAIPQSVRDAADRLSGAESSAEGE